MLCRHTLGLLVVVLCWVERGLMEEVQVQVRQQDEKVDKGLYGHRDEEVQEGLDVGGLDWTWETCSQQQFMFYLCFK